MTPTRITRDDALNALLETNEKLSDLAVGLGRLEERFAAMDLERKERNEQQDTLLQERLDAIHTRLDEIKAYETSCPISTVGKDVEALKRYNEDYPTLMYIFKKRTKVALMWTAFGLSLLIIFLAPWMDKRVAAALFKFAGVPEPIVNIVLGIQ